MTRSPAKVLGASPRQIDRELRAFSRAARLLSSRRPRLINKHAQEWVGLFDGQICATDRTFNGLVKKLKRRGFPPSDTIIRYIDTSERKLIL
jgi:hypothetical protein